MFPNAPPPSRRQLVSEPLGFDTSTRLTLFPALPGVRSPLHNVRFQDRQMAPVTTDSGRKRTPDGSPNERPELRAGAPKADGPLTATNRRREMGNEPARGSPTNYSRLCREAEIRQKPGRRVPTAHNIGHNLGHNSSGLLGQLTRLATTSTTVMRPSRAFPLA